MELLVAIPGPDFSFIDFCQTSVCPHIQCGRGGRGRGGVGDCGGGLDSLVVFVTPHSVVVVLPPSHSTSLPPPWGFHLVKTHRFLV